MPNNPKQVEKLVRYIEENLRASKSAGIEFVDPRNFQTRLTTRQNHAVFGRRGAGKSTLVTSINKMHNCVIVQLNLEDYKDVSFPNIILHILLASFKNLRNEIKRRNPWYKFNFPAFDLCNALKEEETKLKNELYEPDKKEEQVRDKVSGEREAALAGGHSSIGVKGRSKRGYEKEISRVVPRDKLDFLRLELTNFKDLFDKASTICKNEPIFLVFDDFYFVSKEFQPDLIDYFHRLTKDTNLFIKIATIKHRSRLYRRDKGNYIGVELGHDIHAIDMDYTLDNFEDLTSFMHLLLGSANRASGANLEIDELFMGDGFTQLCLASGGVPRDFLSLFVDLVNKSVRLESRGIGKIEVTEAAIANVNSKIDSFRKDTGSEENILEKYLNTIKDFVYTEKRTNAFLVAKNDFQNFPQEAQAIRELIDSRLIHLVEKSTSSAPSDGLQYEAYIIDISLYDSSRPRDFNQIEPGEADAKSRKDKIRSAPKLSLKKISQEKKQAGIQKELLLSEE